MGKNNMDSSLILCTDASPDVGLFDFSIAPEILYYAYVPIICIALLLGVFVFIKDRFSVLSRILLFITVTFSLFIANELIQWIAVPAGLMYFAWALSLLLHFLVILGTVYFVLVFVQRRDLSFINKLVLCIIAIPVIFFLPTNLNLIGFDVDWCGGIAGPTRTFLAFYVCTWWSKFIFTDILLFILLCRLHGYLWH
jgi:hypothetical protein